MASSPDPSSDPVLAIPVLVAADIQDALLTSLHDLHRLQGLLDHAAGNLIQRFGDADAVLTPELTQAHPRLLALREALRNAITELQFHDMATQLVAHTGKVLEACSSQLSAEAMGSDEGEEPAVVQSVPPERANPVTQSEMDAGSIELF
ncbi:hypothetical protein [Comamonas sp. NLF-1-9]|uniref:hypothetical protein n=1 Tax=Comamonas sp. NLF-1-9 TaxID=2853163 RepID=UPI001C483D77|nr:hypothetical protein [Comamonas sp. NLF-1-9]QXL85936.1 hypothetical protein KUD94_13770 [Comamonas sp. NLF-1-9]